MSCAWPVRMAGADSESDIRAFYSSAGLEEYVEMLVDEGFDSLSNLLSLDETGLQEL